MVRELLRTPYEFEAGPERDPAMERRVFHRTLRRAGKSLRVPFRVAILAWITVCKLILLVSRVGLEPTTL